MKRLLFSFLMVIIIPGRSYCQEKDEPAQEETDSRNEIHPQPKEYFVDVLAPHLWEDTQAIFSTDNIPALAVTGFVTGIAATQDTDFRESWLAHDRLAGWEVVGNTWGEGYTQAGLALGFWGAGWLAKDQKLASTGEVLMEAEIINGVVTTAAKALVGRTRPDLSGDDSFPSGHTSDSFCFAAVIDDRYGHAWGIPAYALAAFTGLSRIESDKHWLSDVAMGAGLGMVIGYSVSRNHDDWPYEKRWRHTEKKPLGNAQLIPIIPQDGKDEAGISVYIPLK